MEKETERFNSLILESLYQRKEFLDIIYNVRRKFDINIYFANIFGSILLGNQTDKFSKWLDLHVQELIQAFSRKEVVFLDSNKIDSSCYLISSTVSGDLTQGITICEYKDPSRNDFAAHVNEKFTALHNYFNGENPAISKNRSNSFSYIISRELMLSDDNIAEKLMEHIYGRAYNFKPAYAIAVFKSKDSAVKNMNTIQTSLCQYTPSSFSMVKDDTILAFLYHLSESDLIEGSTIDQLEKYAVKYDLVCGVSSCFTGLNRRMAFLRQARDTLALGNKLHMISRVCLADSVYSYLMLSGVITSIGADMISLASIQMIDDYDRKNHTEYLETLKCYVEHSNNASATAQSLYVDRSTLKYRLDKMENLISNDFEDPYTTLRLKIGLNIHFLCHPYNKSDMK